MSFSVYDPSVTELLLVVVFQLGICITLLAETATGAQGAASPLTMIGQLVGIATALAALLVLVVRLRVRTRQ